jgi:hypothetical protein
MKFNFVYDKYINGKPYPNLAQATDISKGYESLWNSYPRTVPMRLYYYFSIFKFPYTDYHINDDYPADSFYPIAFAWFDFSIDYISLIPDSVKQAVRENKLKLLFYYHEGDNPNLQCQALNSQCHVHQIPKNYKFVTGNSAIKDLPNFVHFVDHELFYYKANFRHQPAQPLNSTRNKDFTALNRIHKWWRATAMTHLQSSNLLSNSFWSYGNVDSDDKFEDNPIEIDLLNLRQQTIDFVNHAPYTCDNLTSNQHNNHSIMVREHVEQSYVHLVFETFFDADQSGGTFLTEKTFKPIKHGQPFVLVAPAGSLRLLRDMGYRTFENVIDSSYDSITNNTLRWAAVYDLIKQLKNQNLQKIFDQCRSDIEHNQKVFSSCGTQRLKALYKSLQS